jgi:hypothetical protein
VASIKGLVAMLDGCAAKLEERLSESVNLRVGSNSDGETKWKHTLARQR